jgi:hypothetical protein
VHLAGECQSAGGGFAARSSLVGLHGSPRGKDIGSIAARGVHLADEKRAHELMIASAEKRAFALERYLSR